MSTNASAAVNDLEISARITRKLREAGFADRSQLTSNWLDPWANSLTAREAQEVIAALQAFGPSSETTEVSLDSGSTETPYGDVHDDITFLGISTRLSNELRRLGYSRVSEVKPDIETLTIAKTTKNKLRSAISEWELASEQEVAAIADNRRAAIASPAKGVWFPSKPLDSFNTSADLVFQIFQEALSSFAPLHRRVLEARAFASGQSDFPTLETLAEEAGVTRERIRQIEKGGLIKCRALILEDKPTNLLVPRRELRSFWQQFLAGIAELEEISIVDLSNLIDATLEVSSTDRSRVLVLLIPLLTLSVTDPVAKQSRVITDVSRLPAGLAALPVTHLRLGRSTDSLVANGIHNIGDFYTSGQNKRYASSKQRAAFDALKVIASNDAPTPQDHELCLSRALGVHVDDFVWRGSVAETYVDFIPWFTGVIEIVFTWGKVKDVFRLRTSLPAGERMALQKLSSQISSSSNSGIAGRVERYILDGMIAIFVHKDLSKCPIHIPSEVNELMASLTSCFSESGDSFELFSTIICHRLDIPEVEVSKSSHLFWALLSGNLPNRYWHLKKRSGNDVAAEEIGFAEENRVVKLKGFRSTY